MASPQVVPAATVTTGAKPHRRQQLARDLEVERANLFLQPSLRRQRVSKVAYPVETHALYHEVHKSLGPTETDERKPRTGLLGPQVYDGLV